MAGRVTALATHISRNCSSFSSVLKIGVHIHHRTTSSKRISLVRASPKPQRDRPDPADDTPSFLSQEDLKYLVKLGGGSVAGAAAIKYGSIIFPEITRPNLPQALLIIFAPVILAIFLLIKQSRIDSST